MRGQWRPHPGHTGDLAAAEGTTTAQRSVHSLPAEQGREDFPAPGRLLQHLPLPEVRRGGAARCGGAARLAPVVVSGLQPAPALLLGAVQRGKRLCALLPNPPHQGYSTKIKPRAAGLTGSFLSIASSLIIGRNFCRSCNRKLLTLCAVGKERLCFHTEQTSQPGYPFPSSVQSLLPILISLALSWHIFGPYVVGGGILAAAHGPGDGESTLGAWRSQDP